ncbi:MAG: hypothetical protein NC213_04600 [Acetobacter sp.]|nr:hypothetical protein [Bacteroides sp.]MCM1341005.1 hypothetical protein [Acetobacter sp.]MCM1432439.1 hypothetical protein [Clostridiales bacterium]
MKKIDFAGNEKVIEQLGYLIDTKRFPHALIIEGEHGLGKRTLARNIAAALVCRNEEKPCMECSQCHKAKENIHPDIFEHSAGGGANSFHVDVVRNVIKDVYVQPNEAEHKVYILGNADCMSVSAQNALLKVLEEPPKYVVFILTAQSKSRLLETVLSRSVIVTLEGVNADEGASYIVKNNPAIISSKAREAVLNLNGNIGKAIDFLENGRESELVDVCCDMCKALVDDNEYALLKLCSAFQRDRQGIVFACDFLKNIFRDALVYSDKIDLTTGKKELAKHLKNKLNQQKLVDLINVCDTLKISANMNCNNSLLITKICYSLREAAGR